MDLLRDFEFVRKNARACGHMMVSAGSARPVEIEDERVVEAWIEVYPETLTGMLQILKEPPKGSGGAFLVDPCKN